MDVNLGHLMLLFTLQKCLSGCPMHARENFAILKQIWPFLVANRLSARNAFHIRVLNYGTIFRLK